MRLRNKRTGEIKRVEFLSDYQNDDGTEIGFRVADTLDVYSYKSLTELNSEWEDVPEQKEYWSINELGTLIQITHTRENIYDKSRKNFGNYFSSREEAEQAVEKLKAWKRLKDKGFKFRDWDISHHNLGAIEFFLPDVVNDIDEYRKDLDLLFQGGEE